MWLAVVLIIAADRQATIDVLCSVSNVYRVKAAISAVIKDITGATAYVWIYGGSIIFERTAYSFIKVVISFTLIFKMRYVSGTTRC